MNGNRELDKSFDHARLWRQEANELRKILVKTRLTEELKWGKPCYTHDGKNICIIQRMNGFLALAVEKAGLRVEKTSALEYPPELVDKLAEDSELGAAFDKLTPGRKRGYVLHFSDAKQSKTRVARIEKCRSKILTGKGLQEQ